MMIETTELITIYYDTKDHPGVYCARKWKAVPGATEPLELLGTAQTLEGIRKLVPEHMVKLERHTEDDPCIVETWI